MRKILIFMAVIMFSTASVFSQNYFIHVEWDNDECSCMDQGDSYYGVRYSIYDTENDIVINAGTLVKVDFGTYEVDIQVPEVYANCVSQLTSKYQVLCQVAVFCDSYTPPEGICSTPFWDEDDILCGEFADIDGYEIVFQYFN